MLRTSLLCLFAALAMGQGDHLAGRREVMSGSGTMRSGLGIRFRTVLTPAALPSKPFGAGGILVDPDALHRYMIDRGNQSYFGYELVIGPGSAMGEYVATVRPLSSRRVFPTGTTLRLMPLPIYPHPQSVREGDIIELDLMVSKDGKEKLTDYIEILTRPMEPAAPTTTVEPRDFTLDDGPVKFVPSSVSVWINGQKSQRSGFTLKPGSTFWITVPGQGRYVLSLTPHAGFVKSGAIRDNVVAFEAGGEQYEIRFMSPIAGAGKAWNLYMLHDPTYRQSPQAESWVHTGVDRLENLLPSR